MVRRTSGGVKPGTFALIPAKGASTRLYRKNMAEIDGRTLLQRAVETAFESDCFEDVFVSTEDAAIAHAAHAYGARALGLRPERLAVDPASILDVVLFELTNLRRQGVECTTLAILLPTSPARNADDVRGAVATFRESDAPVLFSVCAWEHSPLNAFIKLPDGRLAALHPEWLGRLGAKATTELPELVRPNGAIVVVDTATLERTASFYSGSIAFYEMPRERSIDIDTALDLQLARMHLSDSQVSPGPADDVQARPTIGRSSMRDPAARLASHQEEMWAGQFGDDYTTRNVRDPKDRVPLFRSILERTAGVKSVLEVGANRGHNLVSFGMVDAGLELHGLELAPSAYAVLEQVRNVTPHQGSIVGFDPGRRFDLVYTCGVLMHLNPDLLPEVYAKIYNLSGRYIFLNEYFNPTPVQVQYRGLPDMLWKRDFAGEMLDLFPETLAVVDYGFLWRRADPFWDNGTWVLMERTG